MVGGELMGGWMDEKNSKVVRETFDTRNNRANFHLLSNTLHVNYVNRIHLVPAYSHRDLHTKEDVNKKKRNENIDKYFMY